MRFRSITFAIGMVLVIWAAGNWFYTPALAVKMPGGPYSSQPLVLSWDDSELAVANPDANTVSIFLVQGDQNSKAAEVAVGKEPSGVAFSPDGTRFYVANRVDGTATVTYSGLTPGAIGLCQVDAQIPAGVRTGGAASNTVTLAIQQSRKGETKRMKQQARGSRREFSASLIFTPAGELSQLGFANA